MANPPPADPARTGKVVYQGQTAGPFGFDPDLHAEFNDGEPKELHPE